MGYTIYKLDSTFNFGQYKGKTIKEIIEQDIEYVSWCLINVDHFVIDYEVESYAKYLQNNGGYPLDGYALMKLDEKNLNINNGAF